MAWLTAIYRCASCSRCSWGVSKQLNYGRSSGWRVSLTTSASVCCGSTILLVLTIPDHGAAPAAITRLPGQENRPRAALRGVPKMAGVAGGRPRWRPLRWRAGAAGSYRGPRSPGSGDGGGRARPELPAFFPCLLAGAEARERRLPEAGGSLRRRCGSPAGHRQRGSSSPFVCGGWCRAGTPQVAGTEGKRAASAGRWP